MTSRLLINLLFSKVKIFFFQGAIRENYCMVLTFSILLILVFILELAAGISGYVLRNETMELVETSLRDSMQAYVHNETEAIHTTVLWDSIQRNVQFFMRNLNYSNYSKIENHFSVPLLWNSQSNRLDND